MSKELLQWTNMSELVLALSLLFVMCWRKVEREHIFITAFLFVHAATESLAIPLLFFRKATGLTREAAYTAYFSVLWTSFGLRSLLFLLMVYGVYAMALRPFAALRDLGMIIFRWVGAISVVLALGIAVGPHISAQGYFAAFVSRIQESVSMLTLCLLLFVCFALRPLGINAKSRLFGTCLGLGIMSTAQLVQSAFMPSATGLYSGAFAITGIGTSVCLVVWTVYFYLPEPKRRMVLLPTTSPYFLWNKISEALNDAPGYVAVAGVTPDSFAPGELDGLEAASAYAKPASRYAPVAVNG